MPYILTVTIDPPGAGSVQLTPMGDYISPGKVSYAPGTVVTLKAFPAIALGYFDHWEGDASGYDITTTVTMNSNKAVTAVFGVPVPTVQLTTGVVGNGWVAPSEGVFNEGDQIILVAYANEGSVFVSWSGDIAGTTPVPGRPNQLSVVMDRDRHIVAEFELAPVPTYHLSVYVPPWAAGGYVEPGSGDYPANSTVTLRAYPLSGYQFLGWGGDASGTNPTYNLYMDSDKNVEAYFEKVPVPEFAGTISRKELEYDNVSAGIPVSSVPLGASVIVHTWGRNDMSTSQILMFHWLVRDPDGLPVLEDTDKTLFGVPPGGIEERMTPRFDIHKPGTWTVTMELLMDPDNPVVVDRYDGILCGITEVFGGTITRKELEYDSVRGAIPVY